MELISTSQERIRELLDYYGISQNELARRCGLEKSSVSHFLSGKRIPNQNSLYIISRTFSVDVAWLMGYDVPMFKEDNKEYDNKTNTADAIILKCIRLVDQMTKEQAEQAYTYLKFITEQTK